MWNKSIGMLFRKSDITMQCNLPQVSQFCHTTTFAACHTYSLQQEKQNSKWKGCLKSVLDKVVNEKKKWQSRCDKLDLS